jgi:hypothetical protein
MGIDIAFDFRTDTPPGKDPDALSPTLRRYHALLWGRPLPNGKPFMLDASNPIRRRYLYHASDLGEFHLTSDSVMQTFSRWSRTQSLIAQIPADEIQAFRDLGYTIGGMMIWPKALSGRQLSINQLRGWLWRTIGDRMDLTLECVRRYYLAEASPLSGIFESNAAFFALFEDFEGFIEHFLLHDLVTGNRAGVRFFLPFDDFTASAIPGDVQSYQAYRESSMAFIHARNQRMVALANRLANAGGAQP